MRSKKIDFYFFSGTGNTKLVVDEMTSFFREHQCIVKLFPIEKNKNQEINIEHTIGLAFPIAVFSSYPFIWKFLHYLPETAVNTEIFFVDTLAGNSFGFVNTLYHILKKKGYKPIAAKEIIMPSNWNFKKVSEEKYNKQQRQGIIKAKKFAHDLIFSDITWKHHPFNNPLTYLAKSKKPWDFMRKKMPLELNSSACIKCGICYKVCPVDNIQMVHFPEFSNRCQLCQRCLNFCPTHAITIKGKNYHFYKAVNDEKELIGDKNAAQN
jgi:ferredoxin/flavodoxin